MQKLLGFALILVILLSGCFAENVKEPEKATPDEEYIALDRIDHSVLEPDEEIMLTDDERKIYSSLVESIIQGKSMAALTQNEETNNLYIEFLKENPYFFLVDEYEIKDGYLMLTYDYPIEKQYEIVGFMDGEFLKIVNYEMTKDDNQLDRMLKIYSYITKNYVYDSKRKDNKELSSPLFRYPDDEVYKILRDKKSLCFGFAYVLKFCYLQYGIKSFNVYGFCKRSGNGHMWVIFEYEGEYYNCDAGWDLSDEGYSKLRNFGKTDNERMVDTLEFEDFSTYHFKEYGEVKCTDERFKIFRGIIRFTYVKDHEFFMVDWQKNQYIFDTETFEMK